MTYEIVNNKLKYQGNNPIHFLKWATKYNELDGTKIKNTVDFENIFPFADLHDKDDNKFKNLKNTEFALAWFKENKFKEKDKIKYFEINHEEYEKVKKLNKLPDIQKFIPYSFILQAKIKLNAPYFSHDDDNFYLIQNPCLKEKVYKVPMVRGSGWKGAIAKAGKELVENKISNIISYSRIFGLGSDEFRKLFDSLEKKKESVMSDIFKFLLFELGVKLTKDELEKNRVVKFLKEKMIETLENEKRKYAFIQVHKGRAIFYPTYFNMLSLEIINPHDRKTRAGTNPIHYEVVPKDTEGTLQIVYIPFDAVLSNDEEVKKQVEVDIEFLTQCIEKVAEIGIGAKEKLGWGRFEFVKKEEKEIKKIICNKDEVTIPVEWINE